MPDHEEVVIIIIIVIVKIIIVIIIIIIIIILIAEDFGSLQAWARTGLFLCDDGGARRLLGGFGSHSDNKHIKIIIIIIIIIITMIIIIIIVIIIIIIVIIMIIVIIILIQRLPSAALCSRPRPRGAPLWTQGVATLPEERQPAWEWGLGFRV